MPRWTSSWTSRPASLTWALRRGKSASASMVARAMNGSQVRPVLSFTGATRAKSTSTTTSVWAAVASEATRLCPIVRRTAV